MKKLLAITGILICITSLFAQGKKDSGSDSEFKIENIKDNGEKVKDITGVIKMYGNMPFAYPGLETSDGKIYSLVSENKKMMKKIRELSGHQVSLKGYKQLPDNSDEFKYFQMLKDGYIYVDDIDEVKSKKKK